MAGRILIVDDVATNRIVLKARLAAACYDTVLAGSGREALERARNCAPDLVLLDLALPDMDGLAVTRALRADPATRDLPVVMFTGRGDASARIAALRAGVDEFLPRPVDDQIMLARIRNLLRASEAVADLRGSRAAPPGGYGFAEPAARFETPERIAIVAGRADTGMRWRAALAPHFGDRLRVMSREQALAAGAGAEGEPDLFLIGADLGREGSGLQLMSDLRCRGGARHSAICIVLPDRARGGGRGGGGGDREEGGGAAGVAMALDLGANDTLPEGFDPEETALRFRALIGRKRASDRLRDSVRHELRLAVIDPLTGLYNRRFALPHLARVAGEGAAGGGGALSGGGACAVMVIDIDRFKTVNDRFGHAAGDAVLAEVARRLGAGLRAGDMLARIGGEEFLLVLPDCGPARARRAAERVRRAVGAGPVRLPPEGRDIAVTVSVGLAMGGVAGECAGALLARADRALLAAKACGRNQVTVSRSAA